MPIKRGYSQATLKQNIATLVSEGYPQAQAVAIAMHSAREAYFKRFPQGALPSYLVRKGESRLNTSSAPKKKATYQKNPTPRQDEQLKSAMRLFHKFTGHKPEVVGKIKKPIIPDVGVVIGPMLGVAYEATRDGITEKYFHEFAPKSRPLLACTFDGTQLYILGGEYDFTEDGIVDRVPRGKHVKRLVSR